MTERNFILRDTISPEDDLRRGFSGNVGAWFDTREAAFAYADRHGSLTTPKQCPISQKWCGDPELGLSGFVFTDATSLSASTRRIAEYVEWRGAPTVMVFASNDVELGVGLDGEDVFRDGWIVTEMPYPFSWAELEAKLLPSMSTDPDLAKARRDRVERIILDTINEWIADPQQPDVQTGWCITQGPCAEFAGEVFEKITKEFPGIDIAIETSEEVAEDLGLEFGGHHAFLRVDDAYYDSHEQGMPSPEYLPFIASEITYARMHEEEEDEVEFAP